MAPGRGRPVKREATISVAGYPTPNESMSSSTDLRFASASFRSHSGFPTEEVERSQSSFPIEEIEQQRRSASVSVRTREPSRPLPSSRQQRTPTQMDIAAMQVSQGLELVGEKVKILVDAISDLRKFGLDEEQVPLPELVLVGDQSAGKSSLMSALTEVQLPRDQGICTKCPANIKTSPGETWQCKILLQQEYRYVPPRGKIHVTKANPFAPWVPQDLEIKEFNTTSNKDELENNIKWAQIALLNHDEDYRQFIPGKGARAEGDYKYERDHTAAKFSPNVIAIEISGPGLPSLSFYDLPGIFRFAAVPEEQYLAEVIENLAKKYIRKTHAIIIWTLAMKTDPSNSSTGKVIQDCNASDRTIGVLTNPDHVHVRHTEYEKILHGQAHVVGHGYFVTRQPDESFDIYAPNYHARARQEERAFFTTGLWVGEWSEFQHRCGTAVIQEFLSQKLAEQIYRSIPDIRKKVEEKTSQVDRDLSLCPDLPDIDISYTIKRLLSKFSNEVQAVVSGSSNRTESDDFLPALDTLNRQFRDVILAMKPKFKLSHPSDQPKSEVIEILSDDEEPMATTPSSTGSKRFAPFQDLPSAQRQRVSESPTPSRFTDGRIQQTPTKAPGQTMKRDPNSMRAPPPPDLTPNGSGLFRRPARPTGFEDTPFSRIAHLGNGFRDLAGLRDTIAKHTRTGLPGLVNTHAHDQLCLEAIAPWQMALEIFSQKIHDLARSHLQAVLYKHLGFYAQTELYKQAAIHLDLFIDEFVAASTTQLMSYWKLENYKPCTLNEDGMNRHKATEQKVLVEQREINRAGAYLNHQMRIGVKKKISLEMSPQERKREMEKRIADIRTKGELGKDPFESEIDVAAYVRGYYVTGGMRFVDCVILAVNGGFLRNIADNIDYHLQRAIGIEGRDGEEICRALMEEDNTIAARRRNLKALKQRLLGFKQRLDALTTQIFPDQVSDPVSGYANGNGYTNGAGNGEGSYRTNGHASVASEDDAEMAEVDSEFGTGNLNGFGHANKYTTYQAASVGEGSVDLID